MKKFQVDKIKFSYNYQFANNFINNLKKYEIDKDDKQMFLSSRITSVCHLYS